MRKALVRLEQLQAENTRLRIERDAARRVLAEHAAAALADVGRLMDRVAALEKQLSVDKK